MQLIKQAKELIERKLHNLLCNFHIFPIRQARSAVAKMSIIYSSSLKLSYQGKCIILTNIHLIMREKMCMW